MLTQEATEKLLPKLTPDFLATMIEAARVVGWNVDYVEVLSFVDAVHHLASESPPTRDAMEPYEDS